MTELLTKWIDQYVEAVQCECWAYNAYQARPDAVAEAAYNDAEEHAQDCADVLTNAGLTHDHIQFLLTYAEEPQSDVDLTEWIDNLNL